MRVPEPFRLRQDMCRNRFGRNRRFPTSHTRRLGKLQEEGRVVSGWG